jgi:tetratricopeptide (TPR) repeat protein
VKKQLIIASIGVLLTISLFYFGNTVPKKEAVTSTPKGQIKQLNINDLLADYKSKLSPSQLSYLSNLENSITRGDVKAQQIKQNFELANFWKDSAKAFDPYIYYLSEASKLDNSEKNLTFAAQLILANLRQEPDEAKLNWQTQQAIGLFEKAIAINPNNDDLKIGLGSCYIFGKGRTGGPTETMQGIQKVLEVVRRDSTNMKAQLVLGIGGYTSGQYDKAIERLSKVVVAQPQNLEAIAFLADAYAAKGNKAEAIKWYMVSKKMANDSHYAEEVDQRIKELK